MTEFFIVTLNSFQGLCGIESRLEMLNQVQHDDQGE